MSESQMCPRRSEVCEVHKKELPESDFWDTARWEPNKNYKPDWPAEFGKPRTCSFCGGVHVDDIINLIELGWEIEPSTKFYKWYIHPPGSALYHKRFLKAIGDQREMERVSKMAHHVVTPPVKLYGQHCTEEQLRKLNNLLDLQRAGNGTVQ